MKPLRAHQTCVPRAGRPAKTTQCPVSHMETSASEQVVYVLGVRGVQGSAYVTSSPGVSHEHSTLGLIQSHFIGLEKLRPRDLVLVEMIKSNCNKER